MRYRLVAHVDVEADNPATAAAMAEHMWDRLQDVATNEANAGNIKLVNLDNVIEPVEDDQDMVEAGLANGQA